MSSVASNADAMDRIYRWQVPIYDLTRKYYLVGRDRLIGELDPPPNGSILEIGCGTGRNLLAVANMHPQAELFGIDVSAVMLDAARSSVRALKSGSRVVFAQADAGSFDPLTLFGRQRFDRIFISYALSMIPGWRSALDRAIGALQPDGRLLIVDFGEMERLPGPVRFGFSKWLAAFSVERRVDLVRELAAKAARNGYVSHAESLLGGYAVYATVRKSPNDRTPAPLG